ncbi:LysR family transcriptional regulator [Tsukamurella tyrosinosolvens]|uniref:LysR family transcriptional regulator n=1 Tax=Tsukamurella tyrosinosolvens TaxID=57704 RepID=UPI001AF03889|nr:LysR family transcriptional regulator [Tsukamurella tyrosinosolvens]QRY83275.1 LysR family transcriptional regulator [Tsukamurella tyrosinosolvens]
METPSVDSLRLLVAVADLGSISAAARACSISQPSASARLRHLERQLRLDLLDRRTRGAELTPEGAAVTEWARSVTAAMDALQTGAEALRFDHTVRIACSQTIAEYLMPAWLARLREHTDEPVHLTVGNSAAVLADVRGHVADLGFIEGPTVPDDLASRTVRTDRMVLVAAPGDRLARRRDDRPLTAAELGELPLVTREPGAGTRDALEAALRRVGLEPNPRSIALGTNAAVKIMVAAGGRAAVLSELAVAAELRDGRLVEIPTEGVDLHRRLRAVRRKDAAPREVVDTLLAVASGRAAGTPRARRGSPR